MKRIVSVLVLIAMMLASVLAVIPASAAKPSDTVKLTYSVNWKSFYDNKLMQSQWWNDDTAKQNNYDRLYTVTVTENSISSAPKGDADNRSYYAKKMFTITADTYYEYTFSVKNNRAKGYAGVLFAYDKDKYPYMVYGAFQNESLVGATTDLSFRKGHQEKDGSAVNNNEASTPTVKLTDDGYGQYKIVYDGYKASLLYLDQNGAYVKTLSDVTLPEGSKVCFGVYSIGGKLEEQNTVSLKDCVLSTFDEVSAVVIAKSELSDMITKGEDAAKKGGYSANMTAALESAISNAKTILNSSDSTVKDCTDAMTALDAAIKGLVDFTALNAAIAAAEALHKNNYYENSWNVDAPLEAAKKIAADDKSTQEDVDGAAAALNKAIGELVDKRHNVLYMGTDPTPSNYNGEGNVFYIDYHKYIAAKGYTAGVKFPVSLDKANDQGNADYVLRLGTISGSGTTSACDGNKTSSTFTHDRKKVTINGVEYGHAFGYSFYKSATVDSVELHLPTDTKIASIDVYGASLVEKDGKVLYGKATKNDEEEAPKTYLGSFTVPDAKAGEKSIIVKGDLEEALRVDYIFFAIKFDENTRGSYKLYEIELYGILDEAKAPSEYKAADFSSLKAQYAIYNSIVEKDYSTESWANVIAALEITDPVNKSCLSTAEEIAAATKTLGDALDALVPANVDKYELARAIMKARELKAIYTPNTWKALTDALSFAEDVFMSAKSAQTATDNAAKMLNDAIAALEKQSDKTELVKAVEEAKKLKKEQYSANLTAWKMFENVLKKAEAACADDNITQDAIDSLLADLILKQADLVPVEDTEPEPEPEPKPDAPEATDPVETEKNDENEAPTNKGGCGSSIALSALTVIGIIGSAVALKKKED